MYIVFFSHPQNFGDCHIKTINELIGGSFHNSFSESVFLSTILFLSFTLCSLSFSQWSYLLCTIPVSMADNFQISDRLHKFDDTWTKTYSGISWSESFPS